MKLQTELDISRRPNYAGNYPEGGQCSDRPSGRTEIRVVQRVEELRSKVEMLALRESELLAYPEIEIAIVRRLLDINSRVAKSPQRGLPISAHPVIYTDTAKRSVVRAKPMIDGRVVVRQAPISVRTGIIAYVLTLAAVQ